ncbi:MAG: FKBP-type peptidyl-prolyl cis-trans isomerase [Deltaproteobacteria bacterium]|nr:FKBP-type peptidyl-prolyl cis-trans isomerase [Deltaproteobacteria bacterium]MBW2153872.1 FKBP-type peptidyl-prolyl cis-trans isomerase [Deltaproteobacteria bacterium]
MSQVKQGDTVKIDFTGKLLSGEVFATTKNHEPLELKIGSGYAFKKFEDSIVGMNTGDVKSIEIQPEDGFGQRDDNLVMVVDKTSLPMEITPQVGLKLQAKQPNGETANLTIIDMDETSVTLDANHPLAGETLVFEVELIEIL